MAAFMWNANPSKWDAVPPGTSGWDALKDYLLDPSKYVYWSTPVHQKKISVGDRAFIWRTTFGHDPSGIIAVGRVEEAPLQLSAASASLFAHPARLPALGWSEAAAPSPWKTGISIDRVFWDMPLQVNFRPAQGTLRELTAAEVKSADGELGRRSRDLPMTSSFREIVTIEPGKRGGRPCIRGMRIAVADILGWLAAGMSHDEIPADYPELTENDIRAALAFAADRERRAVTAAE